MRPAFGVRPNGHHYRAAAGVVHKKIMLTMGDDDGEDGEDGDVD